MWSRRQAGALNVVKSSGSNIQAAGSLRCAPCSGAYHDYGVFRQGAELISEKSSLNGTVVSDYFPPSPQQIWLI
jgi:hypothetical protein